MLSFSYFKLIPNDLELKLVAEVLRYRNKKRKLGEGLLQVQSWNLSKHWYEPYINIIFLRI